MVESTSQKIEAETKLEEVKHELKVDPKDKELSLIGKKRTHEEAEKERDIKESDKEGESIYEVRDGLRFVKPYEHKFETYSKRRWIGVSLIEVFSSEFKAFSVKYYREAITKGKILVNGKIVCPDNYRLKDGDKIVHTTLR